MTKNTKRTTRRAERDLTTFRFVATLFVFAILALTDLFVPDSEIPTAVYLIIGGLNGVDSYKLYKDVLSK